MAIEPVPSIVALYSPVPNRNTQQGNELSNNMDGFSFSLGPWGDSIKLIGDNVLNNANETKSLATAASADASLAQGYRDQASGFAGDAEGFKNDSQTILDSNTVIAAAVQSAAGLPSLTGKASQYLQVNETEDGVEWAEASGGGTNELATYINTDASGSVDLDFAQYSAFEITATGNLTLNAINLPTGATRASVFLNAVNFDDYTITQGTGLTLDSVSFSSGITNSTTLDSIHSLVAENPAMRQSVLSPDGTKLFVASTSPLTRVLEYNIGDGGSLTYVTDYDPGAVSSFPLGLAFSTDGTKFFLFDSDKSIYQFSVSSAFSLESTVTYSGYSFDTSTQVTGSPRDIAFSTDGTTLFALDTNLLKIFQYSLSAGFDLNSTVTYTTYSFDASAQITSNLVGLSFSADGGSFFVTNQSSTVYKYNCSVPFSFSTTPTYSLQSFNFSANTVTGVSTMISDDNEYIYVSGQAEDTIYKYKMPVPLIFSAELVRVYLSQFSDNMYGSRL